MDYLEIRELYHSLQVDEERRRFLSEFDIYNRDFLDDLPHVVKDALESLKWRFKQEDWFLEAWEKYRQHVLEAGLGGAIKMPGYIFKPYLERYFDEHPERFGLLNNNCGECSYSDLDIGEYLEHHGIKGQKWGIRRFQNEDGSLTAEGKQRYDKIQKEAAKYEKKSQKQQEYANSIMRTIARRNGLAYDSEMVSLENSIQKSKRYKDIANSLKNQKITDKTFDEINNTNKVKIGAKATTGLLAGALGGAALSYKQNQGVPVSSSTIESTLANIGIGAMIGGTIGLISSIPNRESKSYEKYKNQK